MEQHPPAGSALIRCNSGSPGSIRRMLALARALQGREGMAVHFALKDASAADQIRSAGFQSHVAPAAELAALVWARQPHLLILDKGSDVTRAELEAMRRDCLLTATIEEDSDLRLACDFAYYPPLPQVLALGWTGARAAPRIGWEWTLTGLDPRQTPPRAFSPRLNLLVAMDSDGEMTARAARILARLDSSFRIRFAIGHGMKDAGKVAAGIVAIKKNYETVEGADDFSIEYAAADLALCLFGVTAYDLAAFGVPTISLGLTADDAFAGAAIQAAGMGLALGVADHVDDEEVLSAVKYLISDSMRRREMREKSLATLDGQAATRIAGELAQALREEKAPVRAAR